MTAIKAYFAKVRDMDKVFDVSLVGYTSADPNFWTSLYSSATYSMVLVNGDGADHIYISGLSKIYDADILDIRMDLQSIIDSSKFAKAVTAIPDLDMADFDNVATTEDFINVIIQNLQPGACALNFDNAPSASGTFTDDFTGTDGDEIADRTGWTLTKDGANSIDIKTNASTSRALGGGPGDTYILCTDQGNANQYIAVTQSELTGRSGFYAAVRLVDNDNFIGYHQPGTGAAGSRLVKRVSGTLSEPITTQGGAGYVMKVECDGSTIQFYRDTGGGFVQVGTDQTITDHQTETRAGIVCTTNQNNQLCFGDFENGLVGGGATVTGTAITGGVTESEIVTGGETIIITLTGDTWVATVGDDNAITDALISGITSAQSETNGWNNVVRANMVFGDVARTSDTIVTITLAAEATYSITANETITITIPATALTAAGEVVATPTFDVTNEGAFIAAWANSSNVLLQPGVAA